MTSADPFIRFLINAAMWIFLGPLIIILGTLDLLTRGHSRSWPLIRDTRAY